RGVLAGVFVGMEVIVPLTLTVQLHYSPTMAGTPLMLSALSWATASAIQSRLPNPNRAALVGLGLVLLAIAGVGMALVALRAVPGGVAFAVWPAAGLGAGFAITSVSVVMLECTTDERRGADSASLQLADSSVSAISAAFAGAFVALAAHGRIGYGTGFAVVFVSMAVLAALAVGRAARLTGVARRRRRSDDTEATRRHADGTGATRRRQPDDGLANPAVPGVTGTSPAVLSEPVGATPGQGLGADRSVERGAPRSVSS
ncbi:MAG: hypothetical protein JO144_13635, partial [Actinobacteria bacterium]|nr:hypothetical protein [Actinomycetota bacterium]